LRRAISEKIEMLRLLEHTKTYRLAIKTTARLHLVLFVAILINRTNQILNENENNTRFRLNLSRKKLKNLKEEYKILELLSFFVDGIILCFFMFIIGVVWLWIRW
jgi:hypothetical protein